MVRIMLSNTRYYYSCIPRYQYTRINSVGVSNILALSFAFLSFRCRRRCLGVVTFLLYYSCGEKRKNKRYFIYQVEMRDIDVCLRSQSPFLRIYATILLIVPPLNSEPPQPSSTHTLLHTCTSYTRTRRVVRGLNTMYIYILRTRQHEARDSTKKEEKRKKGPRKRRTAGKVRQVK